jgi:arylformamidase
MGPPGDRPFGGGPCGGGGRNYAIKRTLFRMSKFIDVTVPLSEEVATFPGDPCFRAERVHSLAGGSPYNVSRLELGTHSGTHVDAPYHFLEDGAKVDELSLDLLIGKVRVVSVAARGAVEREHLEQLDLRDDLRLLFKTRNSGQMRQPFQPDFVYLSPDAATFLVQVGIKLVGWDYLSLEKHPSTDFATHHILLGAGVVIIEGLDLSLVDPGEYDMICLPLRLQGGDGSPARVVLRPRL